MSVSLLNSLMSVWFSVRVCARVSQIAECCKGFYGPDCKPCIGGFQHPCYDKGVVSRKQPAHIPPSCARFTDFIFIYTSTTCSALTVSMATAHAAVSQASRASPATSVRMRPSMETSVTKVTASPGKLPKSKMTLLMRLDWTYCVSACLCKQQLTVLKMVLFF